VKNEETILNGYCSVFIICAGTYRATGRRKESAIFDKARREPRRTSLASTRFSAWR